MDAASVPPLMRPVLSLLALAPLLSGLGACDAAGGNPAFRANGEVIAFSGGDGGATQACATCHGLRGEGDGRLSPRLAGLDAGYLHRQLDDYANGRREHAPMRAIVRRLGGEDRARVSAYYAGLPAPAERLARTSALYARRCASCHGVAGEGGGPGNPPLAGQPPAYIAAQLEAWRSGKRRDNTGAMLAVSRALASAEIRLLADHARADRVAAAPPSADRSAVPAASR